MAQKPRIHARSAPRPRYAKGIELYRTRSLIVLVLVAATVAVWPGVPTAETNSQTAARLVSLVKPHEREAQAIRFMLMVAPSGFPAGLADCMVEKATPAYKEYFAAQYAKHLSESELRQAVTFFKSEVGRAAITIQLQHEQDLFNDVAKGKQIGNEKPEYPLWVRKELEAFGSTLSGRHFVGGGPEVSQPFSSEISDLRNSVMAKCLADPALRGSRK